MLTALWSHFGPSAILDESPAVIINRPLAGPHPVRLRGQGESMSISKAAGNTIYTPENSLELIANLSSLNMNDRFL
jgi:hypothetical protein